MIPCFQWIRVQIFLICYMPFFTFFQTAGKGFDTLVYCFCISRGKLKAPSQILAGTKKKKFPFRKVKEIPEHYLSRNSDLK